MKKQESGNYLPPTSLFSQYNSEARGNTALPISVITGEELREKETNSLGDTLSLR